MELKYLRQADPEVGAVRIDRQRVGGVGLELDRVGARLGRRVNDLLRALDVAAVVGRHLGDQVGRPVGADLLSGDRNPGAHLVRLVFSQLERQVDSFAACLDVRSLVRRKGPRPQDVD